MIVKSEFEAAHELRVMNHTGDLKLTWDSDKQAEVDHARKTFDEMRKKGYAAFKVRKLGGTGEQIHEFDPDAEAIIMQPALVGG